MAAAATLRIHPRRAAHPPEERRPEPPPDPGEDRTLPPNPETLAHRPPRARTITELQGQLDAFREHYNHHRPHRALDDRTPADAYAATPKAIPADTSHYRLRYDHVGSNGKISFRRAGRMHHLGIGALHRGKRAMLLADDTTVTVIHLDTGEILATNTIDPDKTY